MKQAHSHLLLLVLIATSVTTLGQENDPDKQTSSDLLHFLNGDYLHGSFSGMADENSVKWQHPDIKEPVEIDPRILRRIALHHEKEPLDYLPSSFLHLHNGDRIPGTVLSMDNTSVRIATNFSPDITIPRKLVARLCPNPHGGKIHYYGPFSPHRWTILKDPKKNLPENTTPPGDKDGDQEEHLREEEWVFSGAAWYNTDNTPLALEADLPDQTAISFNLAWKNRLNATIAFHASLSRPEPQAKQNEGLQRRRIRANNLHVSKNQYPDLFGESYVLSIIGSYAQLHRCTFDDDGNPTVVSLDSTNFNVQLEETGDATFELRCDRDQAEIALYVDGRFITQWTDRAGYAGTGNKLAFSSTSGSARMRISEVIVSSWNGMSDSARSMETPDRDVILLTNGTDRFSGQVQNVENDHLVLDGTFAQMTIPLSDIQEIRLASGARSELSPDPSDQAVRLLLYPVGRITVMPTHSTKDSLEFRLMDHNELKIDLRLVDVMEFTFGKSALDSWTEDF